MVEALKEGGEVRTSLPITTVAMNQPQTRSYREVLQQSRASVPLCEQNRPKGRSDTLESLSGAVGPIRASWIRKWYGRPRY